jgi:large-conductance mechanosensitive channel
MDIINEFNNFLFDRGILSIMIGTIAGLAVTNLVKDMNDTLIYPLLKRTRYGVLKLPIISSMIEFLVIMIFIYGIYHMIIYPWFKRQIDEEKREKERNKKWRSEILSEVRDIDMGTIYV